MEGRGTRSAAPSIAARAVVGLLFAFGLLLSFPVQAQAPSDSEIERLEEEERQRKARTRAVGKAKERRPVEGAGDITFEDVLDDPDNLELNFRYAKAQIDSGNLTGAVATLERMLLIDPDLAEIRVYYGLVLFRLDSLGEAERQLQEALKLPLDGGLKKEAERYLAEIIKRKKRFRAAVQFSVGAHYDWNRNAASDTGQNLVLDSRLDLDEDDRRLYDWAAVGSLRGDFSYDLGFQAPHRLIGSFTYYHDDQMDLDHLDTKAGTITGGVKLVYPWATVTPNAFLTVTSLSHERYYRGRGVKLRADRRVGDAVDVHATGIYTHTKYDVLTESTSSKLRSGHRWDWEAGAEYTINPIHRISATYRHIASRAKENYLEYNAHEAEFGHTWLTGNGQFLLTFFGYRRALYRDNDPAVSDKRRNDDRFRASLTYGLPLKTVIDFKGVPEDLKDAADGWTWTFSAEYLTQYSNIINYQYQNRRFQTMLMKRWDF